MPSVQYDEEIIESGFYGWIFYRGLHHHLGLCVRRQWQYFRRRMLAMRGQPWLCASCGVKCEPVRGGRQKRNTVTIDHIIPKSMLFELEIVELLFDEDNMAIYCRQCNSVKGNVLPENIPLTLLCKFQAAIDARNKELGMV